MAIKRLKMGDDGEFEERELEKSELPPPPPKPVKKRSSGPRISSGTKKSPKTPGSATSSVKVTKRATKSFSAGKTALDHDVIRYECQKCGSSRVGTEETTAMKCSLCQVPMKRLR